MTDRFLPTMEQGDVRLVVPASTGIDVAARLSVARAVHAGTLDVRSSELYVDEHAIVPNPRSYRSLTQEELDCFVVRDDDWRQYEDQPGCAMLFPADFDTGVAEWERYRTRRIDKEIFGLLMSQPDMLTTTIDTKFGLLRGMHFDRHPKGYKPGDLDHTHRLGVNFWLGDRALLVATRSAAQLSADAGRPITTTNDLKGLEPDALGSVVRVRWRSSEFYKLHTGGESGVVHDASTLLSVGEAAVADMHRKMLGSAPSNRISEVGFVSLHD
jgi:hypothetical protein